MACSCSGWPRKGLAARAGALPPSSLKRFSAGKCQGCPSRPCRPHQSSPLPGNFGLWRAGTRLPHPLPSGCSTHAYRGGPPLPPSPSKLTRPSSLARESHLAPQFLTTFSVFPFPVYMHPGQFCLHNKNRSLPTSSLLLLCCSGPFIAHPPVLQRNLSEDLR